MKNGVIKRVASALETFASWFVIAWVPLLPIAIVSFCFRYDDIRGYFISLAAYSKTTGRVTESRVEYRNGRFSNYHFVIKYRYQIDGKTYVSNKVNFVASGSRDSHYAASYVASYPMNAPVTVHYLAQQPRFAVLEPWVKSDWLIWISLGSAALSLASWLLTICLYIFDSKRAKRIKSQMPASLTQKI